MAGLADTLTSKGAVNFMDQLGAPFKSLPKLPAGIVDFFVSVAPWLALIGGVLSLIAGPLIGIIGSIGSLASLSPYMLILTLLSTAMLVAQAVLLLMAFTPLKNREFKGWALIFWSQMLGIVDSLLSIVLGDSSRIVGTIIGVLIGLYILYQMRPRYNGQVVEGEMVSKK
jgi:hypothetical protein